MFPLRRINSLHLCFGSDLFGMVRECGFVAVRMWDDGAAVGGRFLGPKNLLFNVPALGRSVNLILGSRFRSGWKRFGGLAWRMDCI